MSLTRIATFIIGLVMAIFGLYLLFGAPFVLFPNFVISLVLIIVGVIIMSGKVVGI